MRSDRLSTDTAERVHTTQMRRGLQFTLMATVNAVVGGALVLLVCIHSAYQARMIGWYIGVLIAAAIAVQAHAVVRRAVQAGCSYRRFEHMLTPSTIVSALTWGALPVIVDDAGGWKYFAAIAILTGSMVCAVVANMYQPRFSLIYLAVAATSFAWSQIGRGTQGWFWAVLDVAYALLLMLVALLWYRVLLLGEFDKLEMERLGERVTEEQRFEAVSMVSASVSHDFNSLMQSVVANLELILLRQDEELSERTVQSIRSAVDASIRASGITGQLLASTRQEMLLAEHLDVAAVLHGVVGDAMVSCPRVRFVKDIRVKASVFCDRTLLQRALRNLVDNAVHANAGRGTVELRARVVRNAPAEFVQICIQDAGGGFAPEALRRATEPFYTTTKHVGSSGLGLSMAQGFAEQSGGSLRLSNTARGALVELQLPAGPSVAAPLMAGAGPTTFDGKGRSILVVDDDATILASLVVQLQMLGFDVHTATTVRGAAAQLVSGLQRFDLMLSDVVLPDGLGTSLLARRSGINGAIPVIFMTAFDQRAFQTDPNLGGAVVLRKPFTQQQLVSAMCKVLLPQR